MKYTLTEVSNSKHEVKWKNRLAKKADKYNPSTVKDRGKINQIIS